MSIRLLMVFWCVVGTPLAAIAQNAPSVAMMYCFGVEEKGNRNTPTSFRAVMEQTNADELDGSVLLDDVIYDETLWLTTPVIFRVRLFQNATPYLIEGSFDEVAERLMGGEVPNEAYDNIDGAAARIAFQSLAVDLKVKPNGQKVSQINYKPSNKRHERYYDNETGADFSVYCEDPFLKR